MQLMMKEAILKQLQEKVDEYEQSMQAKEKEARDNLEGSQKLFDQQIKDQKNSLEEVIKSTESEKLVLQEKLDSLTL